MSKRQIKIYRSTIRRSLKFLYGLNPERDVKVNTFKTWSNTIDKLQKKLTESHLLINENNYSEAEVACWGHLGLALHYLLDGLYHLFLKASSTASVCCKWCNSSINSWAEVLANTVGEAAPSAYLYLDMAHQRYTNNETSLRDICQNFLDLSKFLCKA